MSRFVVLSPAANADVAQGFDVRVGPLAFVCLADALDRTLGEALDTVGAVLTAAEPRPRPLKVVLPVRGTGEEADPRELVRKVLRDEGYVTMSAGDNRYVRRTDSATSRNSD